MLKIFVIVMFANIIGDMILIGLLAVLMFYGLRWIKKSLVPSRVEIRQRMQEMWLEEFERLRTEHKQEVDEIGEALHGRLKTVRERGH